MFNKIFSQRSILGLCLIYVILSILAIPNASATAAISKQKKQMDVSFINLDWMKLDLIHLRGVGGANKGHVEELPHLLDATSAPTYEPTQEPTQQVVTTDSPSLAPTASPSEEATLAPSNAGATSSSDSKKLSGGAVAGIVIGVIVGTGLIMFAIYYFLIGGRRSNNRDDQNYEVVGKTPVSPGRNPVGANARV